MEIIEIEEGGFKMRLIIKKETCYNGIINERIAVPYPNAYNHSECKGCSFTFICRLL